MVHCRVRPLNEEDIKSYGRDTIIDTLDQNKGLLVLKRDFDKKTFVFESVFDQTSSQQEIYSKVGEPVVSSILQGYNGTIFAYGQTGTGKTFTMIGQGGESKGVIPRSISQIFAYIQSSTTHSFQVKVGFMQLYMEMLQDLLRPDETKTIRIREDPEEGVYLTGVHWANVSSVKACMELLALGDRNRSTAFTSMNAHSSRSHAVYMVKIEKRMKYTPEQLEELEKKGDLPDQSMTKSTLYLVDLAGSERVSKSRASGSRLDEARNINLALLALGNCIQALSDKKAKYVPFRDSKLTRILEDSLGGNSKTSLIVTIGPSAGHVQESLSALQFGLRAMKIENRPELNIKVDYRALCAQLQAELDKINDGSNMYNIEKDQYLEEINSLKAQVEKLMAEREQMESLLEEYRKGHNDLTKFEEKNKLEIQKLQNGFKVRLEKKEAEHKKFLDEIDKLMLDQEKDMKSKQHEIVELKNQNKQFNNELKHLQGELEQERSDRELRSSQMVTEIDELKQKLQAEKAKAQEYQQEIKEITDRDREKANQLQEAKEANEFLKAQHAQEAESMAKELKKSQANYTKMKQQLAMKANEWKESSEKIAKNWQENLDTKEREFSEKKEAFEKSISSMNLYITQLEREKTALRDDILSEQSNSKMQAKNFENVKENYESKINVLSNEIGVVESRLSEADQFCAKLNEELALEKKSHKEDVNGISDEVKNSKRKNAKLIKAYRELEAASESKSKEFEQKLFIKSEEFTSLTEAFQSEKQELLKEIETITAEKNDINKDRSKLIAKLENISKKASSIAKQKDKLYTEAEAKQQEYKSLMDHRESLEAEIESAKNQIEELSQNIRSKEQSNEDLKSSILKLSNECYKKESNIKNIEKIRDELQGILTKKDQELSENKEYQIDLKKEIQGLKVNNEELLKNIKTLDSEKGGLSKEVRQQQADLEKNTKEIKNLTENLKNLEREKNEVIQTYNQHRDQLSSKLTKLTEDYKILEAENSNLKNEFRAKKIEISTARDNLFKYCTNLMNSLKATQDSIFQHTNDRISSIKKIQRSLISHIQSLKESVRNKSYFIEKIQASNKKDLLLLGESQSRDISSLKSSHKELIESLEEKYSQELQEQQLYFEDIIKRSNQKNEKSQQDLKEFYLSQLDNQAALEKSQYEDMKSSHNKQVSELKSSLTQQLFEIKEDSRSQISLLEGETKKLKSKHSDELSQINRDWENKLDEAKRFDEEAFNAMMKSKQKEIEQLTNENNHLRNEFETTLDRQRDHSSVMKNHQLGLIEEIYKGHKQEIEAITIENENKVKRKENEIAEVKKKLRELSEMHNEKLRELEEKENVIDNTRAESKKLEAEIKKVEYQKQVLDGEVKLITKKYDFERNKNIEGVRNI